MKEVKSLKIEKDMKISELVEEMGNTGFGAGMISKAGKILKEMKEDKDCKVFFGQAGAMVPAGMKGTILDVLNFTDVFVCTGATLTHDLIEALGDKHYFIESKNGNFNDEDLNKKGLDRIYNVAMPNSTYEKMEDFFKSNWENFRDCKNIKEFIWKLGELCPGKSENCILKKCYEKKIPIFCPALADSGIGLMIWGRNSAGEKIQIDAFDDMNEIIDIAWTAKKRGILYVGGGVPKNFIQQSLQFSKGAQYGIQITTDRVEPGGSSGAPLKEGISWGKMESDAKFVDVLCDATIALPLIIGYIK